MQLVFLESHCDQVTNIRCLFWWKMILKAMRSLQAFFLTFEFRCTECHQRKRRTLWHLSWKHRVRHCWSSQFSPEIESSLLNREFQVKHCQSYNTVKKQERVKREKLLYLQLKQLIVNPLECCAEFDPSDWKQPVERSIHEGKSQSQYLSSEIVTKESKSRLNISTSLASGEENLETVDSKGE